ncbi:MAG: twin-arginine translocase TatA/TatE family subunit [Deltaproteobacteria bacterium]|nr:twin-arginine translocase TatA/TatE family subunit [Deltaproteobacteria bacterium]
MPHLGAMELIVILLIVLLIFGAGRLATLGEALGKGIRNFKKAVSGRDEPPGNGRQA